MATFFTEGRTMTHSALFSKSCGIFSGVSKISFITCPDSFNRSRSWSPLAAAKRGQRESPIDVTSKAWANTNRDMLDVLWLFTVFLPSIEALFQALTSFVSRASGTRTHTGKEDAL